MQHKHRGMPFWWASQFPAELLAIRQIPGHLRNREAVEAIDQAGASAGNSLLHCSGWGY
jgi:hypothetical protein